MMQAELDRLQSLGRDARLRFEKLCSQPLHTMMWPRRWALLLLLVVQLFVRPKAQKIRPGNTSGAALYLAPALRYCDS